MKEGREEKREIISVREMETEDGDSKRIERRENRESEERNKTRFLRRKNEKEHIPSFTRLILNCLL
jgi:hypothetical protein